MCFEFMKKLFTIYVIKNDYIYGTLKHDGSMIDYIHG